MHFVPVAVSGLLFAAILFGGIIVGAGGFVGSVIFASNMERKKLGLALFFVGLAWLLGVTGFTAWGTVALGDSATQANAQHLQAAAAQTYGLRLSEDQAVALNGGNLGKSNDRVTGVGGTSQPVGETTITADGALTRLAMYRVGADEFRIYSTGTLRELPQR